MRNVIRVLNNPITPLIYNINNFLLMGIVISPKHFLHRMQSGRLLIWLQVAHLIYANTREECKEKLEMMIKIADQFSLSLPYLYRSKKYTSWKKDYGAHKITYPKTRLVLLNYHFGTRETCNKTLITLKTTSLYPKGFVKWFV